MASNPFSTRRRTTDARTVAVVGLGRFGGALATELARTGTEVMGLDTDEDIVQSFNGVLTHVLRADATRQEVLDQIGIAEFDRVVIGIGNDIQASILTASMLRRMDLPSIWAKAINPQHGLILEQLGIDHVVYPEADMGRRVAHLVRGSMLDYVEFDHDLVVAKTVVPESVVGRRIDESEVRRRWDVTIVKIKSSDGVWRAASGETVPRAGDLAVVIGPRQRTEVFCSA